MENYFTAIKKLEQKGTFPLNQLYLEISEKLPIPRIDDILPGIHPIEAFREQLFKYQDLEIRFSIDDFGVGYASSSRISRIGPACIKIDRDALLDTYGNFTLDYVIRLARRIPGDIRVVIEGHDEHSKLTLRKLFDLGVRYVQSTKYVPSTPNPSSHLPEEVFSYIRKELDGLNGLMYAQ